MQSLASFVPLRLAGAGALLAVSTFCQSPLQTGNLVLVRVGDGTATINSNTQAVYLDEVDAAGNLVQSLALPTTTVGNQRQFTIRGGAGSEGYLNLSPNGQWLTLAGYDTPPLSPLSATEGSPAATTPRVIARIDRFTGQVDTSTALVDAYDGSATIQGNVRSAITDDGNRFWLSGTGAAQTAGIRFVAALGDSTSIQVSAGAPTNTRVVGTFDGQLYMTSASTVYLGVCSIGQGMPTTSGQLSTLLTGFPTSGGTSAGSAYGFFFADPNTLYVADDNTSAASQNGGIGKWTQSGGVWTRQYVLRLNGPTATTGMRGLTGFVRDGVATLWATANTAGQTTTTLVTVTDTGPNSLVVPLATSAANTQWKSVQFLPKPPAHFRVPAACGTADIAVYGNGEVGTQLRAQVSQSLGFPILGISLNPAQQSFCGCTLIHDFAVMAFGGAASLSLPNDPALFGLAVFFQGADFLAPGGCPNPQFALTDGIVVSVQ
ncbi:MAG: hypothetical protein RL398_1166 [Planctomycetota bacterium]